MTPHWRRNDGRLGNGDRNRRHYPGLWRDRHRRLRLALGWRGRTALEREEAYQKLAQDMSDAQRRAAFELGQIAEDLADVRERMVELERVLKEVG